MAKAHYQVLARKWRPQTFDEVVGQEHIGRALQNAIRAGRIGHAYLFIGSRGIGKTTTARILAKALNCQSADQPTPEPCGTCSNCVSIAAGNNIDVIEIDGASNNSVEDVRQLRDNIRMVPSASRYKIYVIDEVHQLSSHAFNALLKTLEEPPEHAVFILATTEAHKIPATIVSRCQRYDFRRVARHHIGALLRRIVEREQVKCGEEAIQAIARAADGGIRDAQSILEQLISYCDDEITFDDVYDVLGLVDWRVLNDLCDAILAKDVAAMLTLVENVTTSGKDLSQFVQDIIRYFRNLIVCKTADAKELIGLPDDDLAEMQRRADAFTLTDLIRLVEQFAQLSRDFDSQIAQRIALECLLIRIAKVAVEVSLDTVLEKLMRLGAGGAQAAGGEPAAPDRERPRPKPAPAPTAAAPASSSSTGGPAKLRFTDANMAAQWAQVAERAAAQELSLGVFLSHATPAAIEGDTLVLEFTRDQGSARAYVEREENRRAVERALAEHTENIRAFRTVQNGHSAAPPSTRPERDSRAAARVADDQARKALDNPHIAAVVNVFRGTIVDIRHLSQS